MPWTGQPWLALIHREPIRLADQLSRVRATPAHGAAKGPAKMKIHVECYAGYQGEETPRRLKFDDREIEVVDVIDRWLAPDHRYFKIRAADGATYILRHDVGSDDWELVMFSSDRVPP